MRLAAGVLAALWAMLGLANAYTVGTTQAADSRVLLAVGSDFLLIVGASLAIVHARRWRALLLLTLLLATVDRVANALSTGAGAAAIGVAIAALGLIGGLTVSVRDSRSSPNV
ncbi:MAG: hypothetical protein M3T49_03395 [Candidatus Eremiobacteraeota bacterium]|nr:hypothetical protein [Candidatus Eremiobacteraeota bacterium]